MMFYKSIATILNTFAGSDVKDKWILRQLCKLGVKSSIEAYKDFKSIGNIRKQLYSKYNIIDNNSNEGKELFRIITLYDALVVRAQKELAFLRRDFFPKASEFIKCNKPDYNKIRVSYYDINSVDLKKLYKKLYERTTDRIIYDYRTAKYLLNMIENPVLHSLVEHGVAHMNNIISSCVENQHTEYKRYVFNDTKIKETRVDLDSKEIIWEFNS